MEHSVTQYARLREVFLELCPLAPPERAGALERLGRDHPALAARVRSLLDHDRLDDIESPIAARERDAMAPTEDSLRIPGLVLDEEIGRGAMGRVFRATRHASSDCVAVKVLEGLTADDSRGARFRVELTALARLDHRGIARVYRADVVTTPRGVVPFLEMEFVDGETISAYVARCTLDVRARLELVAEVADAVHHAHMRQVVHRDLKPANILVTAEGRPKLVDFGVARLLDDDRGVTVGLTGDRIVGTLAYMSPEQASGGVIDVDARSDVYALGVIAYELVSGQLPVDLDSVSITEALRRIESAERTALGTVTRLVPRDVAGVIDHAIERGPDQRYDSAAAFAEDLRRALRDEPVSVRPPGAVEQLRRLVRRHRAVAAGLALTLLLLLVAAAGVGYGWSTAQAEVEGAIGVAIRYGDAMVEIPGEVGMGPAYPLHAMVPALRVLARDADLDARVRAPVALTAGRLESRTGSARRAREDLAFAASIRPDDALHQARVALELGHLERRVGEPESARRHYRHADALARGTDDEIDVRFAVEIGRGRLDTANGDRAAAETRLATAVARAEFDDVDPLLRLEAQYELASAIAFQGRYDEAVMALTTVHAAAVAHLGAHAPFTLAIESSLLPCLVRVDPGHRGAATDRLEDVLARQTNLLGRLHPEVIEMQYTLANLLARGGAEQTERALRLYQDARDRRRQYDAEPSDELARYQDGVASALVKLERFREAIDDARAAYLHFAERHDPESVLALRYLTTWAAARAGTGDAAGIEMLKSVLGRGNPNDGAYAGVHTRARRFLARAEERASRDETSSLPHGATGETRRSPP